MTLEVVSVATNVFMAMIWVIYLQKFVTQYRRTNRPVLIIHHAQGNDPSALCLFVNMSKEPIHVVGVFANMHGSNGHISRHVTEYHRMNPYDQNLESHLRQGPLQPGGYLVLGSFEDIILGRQSDPEDDQDVATMLSSLREIHSLEICVAAIHGPSKHYIGARRHFAVENEEGEVVLRAHSIYTEQLVNRWKRKLVRQWAETLLEPQHRGKMQTQHTSQGEDAESN